jgi:hypothetical protein
MVRWQWSDPSEHPLRRYARRIGWEEARLMNALQERGIISDNCVTIDDVGNYARAMSWLHERITRKEL